MLCSPGIHIQSSTEVDFWIFPTLFVKNVWYPYSPFGLLPAWFACQPVEPRCNVALECVSLCSLKFWGKDTIADFRFYWVSLLVKWRELCF